jgi:hypothetical protein
MQHHRTFIAIAITLVIGPLSVSRPPTAASALNDLTVHEWGTFTSIAGEDGAAVEWTPQSGPPDLPCFVDRSRFNIKGWMPGKIRMETPVLYFYAKQDIRVNVNVRFRQGVVTEWFPSAVVTASSVTSTSLRSAAFESSITWRDVKVAPGTAADFRTDAGPSHYYTARNTDASPVQSGSEKERFLFYRGVGGFEPPLTAAVGSDGKIVVANPGGDAVGDVILFENRGGTMAYEVWHAATSRATLDPPMLERESRAPLTELEKILTAHGLYPKEATAMVQTWRDSWFEEGTRLFYIASRKTIDAILPLEVTPAPGEVQRVFVGRIELVTPATEAAVRDAIAGNDGAVLRKYGRFLDSIVSRLFARSTPAERARAQAIVRPMYSFWTPPAACK